MGSLGLLGELVGSGFLLDYMAVDNLRGSHWISVVYGDLAWARGFSWELKGSWDLAGISRDIGLRGSVGNSSDLMGHRGTSSILRGL